MPLTNLIPETTSANRLPQDRLDTYLKRSILAPRLLVIDEIGYLPFGRAEANLFFNVITNRYEVSSVIVTSNLPFSPSDQAHLPMIRP